MGQRADASIPTLIRVGQHQVVNKTLRGTSFGSSQRFIYYF